MGTDDEENRHVEATDRASWLSATRDALLAQCEITHTRRQGPGGQHRNKVSTAVVLEHGPSGLRVEAAERRSQRDNLRMAVERLRLAIARHCRVRVDGEHYVASELWTQRCRQGRVTVSVDHADFAPVLAEALDVLEVHDWRPAPAASQLGCTTSQLVRLIQQDSAAWASWNRHRKSAGLDPLR